MTGLIKTKRFLAQIPKKTLKIDVTDLLENTSSDYIDAGKLSKALKQRNIVDNKLVSLIKDLVKRYNNTTLNVDDDLYSDAIQVYLCINALSAECYFEFYLSLNKVIKVN